MNTQSLNTKSKNNPVDRNSQILHEQLALKRLKELRLEARKSPARKRSLILTQLRKVLLTAWALFMKKPSITHHVSPGQLPVEWHGHERARELRALRML